jgi:hypothetical protein
MGTMHVTTPCCIFSRTSAPNPECSESRRRSLSSPVAFPREITSCCKAATAHCHKLGRQRTSYRSRCRPLEETHCSVQQTTTTTTTLSCSKIIYTKSLMRFPSPSLPSIWPFLFGEEFASSSHPTSSDITFYSTYLDPSAAPS